MVESPRRHTLPRSARIHSGIIFRRIFRLKRIASDHLITIYMAPNNIGINRLGLAVGRHLGNAVYRNRTKRLIREAFRQIRLELPGPADWVIIPKTGQDFRLPDLKQSILSLAYRLGQKSGINRDFP